MKAATGIGIGVAIGGILFGAMMEGVSPAVIINIPAILIVIVGTAGATIAAVGMDRMKAVPSLYKRVLNAEPQDLKGRVNQLVSFAEMARRDGLLALDEHTSDIDDEFTRKGLQLVVDGTDPELVRDILDSEIGAMETRHKAGADTFKQAGGFAPTMGILGTVLSLLHVLGNLSQPEALGPMISSAFIATLLGVGAANVIFLPVSNRLKELSADEVVLRSLTVEGILSIQAGDNPRLVGEKLSSYVPPAERDDPDAAEEPAPIREAAAA